MSAEGRTQAGEVAVTVRDVLAAHFVMWHEMDGPGPRGEWRCSCGSLFGFSDSAIDHVTDKTADAVTAWIGARLAEVREDAWKAVADVRDASPRKANDADTDDVIDAALGVVAAALGAQAGVEGSLSGEQAQSDLGGRD